MNSLYTPGAIASIDAIESEPSCHPHFHSPSIIFLIRQIYLLPPFMDSKEWKPKYSLGRTSAIDSTNCFFSGENCCVVVILIFEYVPA